MIWEISEVIEPKNCVWRPCKSSLKAFLLLNPVVVLHGILSLSDIYLVPKF